MEFPTKAAFIFIHIHLVIKADKIVYVEKMGILAIKTDLKCAIIAAIM
ncbi:hypothetical protein [Paenochrobactrum pullorum]